MKLHEISLAQLKEFNRKDVNLKNDIKYLQQILGDKLYQTLGVDSEELDSATERLKLEDDKEFIDLQKKYQEAVKQLKLG